MAISLEGVSNEELVSRLMQLSEKEKRCTHRIILHLAELERRRLYAELGFTSLYDYATRKLGYSAASAQRRIKAARAVMVFPEVYECLEDGRLSMRVLEKVAEPLSGPRGRELLREICGKPQDEALRVIATFFPVQPETLSDRIEPIFVKALPGPDDAQRCLFNSEENTCLRAEACNVLGNEEQFRISFTASAKMKDKLDRVRELLYASEGPADLEILFGRVLDDFIKRHCPEERYKRRLEKAKRKAVRQGESVLDAVETLAEVAGAVVDLMPEKERDPAKRRYPDAKLRDAILSRDGHRCTYVAPSGVRCECRSGLQIDHIIPWAHGGRTEPANLQTVCKTHNLMLERKHYGDDYVDDLIARRKPDALGRATVYVDPSQIMDPLERMLFG